MHQSRLSVSEAPSLAHSLGLTLTYRDSRRQSQEASSGADCCGLVKRKLLVVESMMSAKKVPSLDRRLYIYAQDSLLRKYHACCSHDNDHLP